MLEVTDPKTFRRGPSPADILRVGRIMEAADRRQKLHARLLCVLNTLISRETRINALVLARKLKVDQHAIAELRPYYPGTFKLIAQYERNRSLWEEGRLSSGHRPKRKRVDPLLARLRSI